MTLSWVSVYCSRLMLYPQSRYSFVNSTVCLGLGSRLETGLPCAGWVYEDGSPKESIPDNCYDPRRLSTGYYEIVFTGPVLRLPVCAVTQVYPGNFTNTGNTRDNAVIKNANLTLMQYTTGRQTGDLSDRQAMFICV